MSSEKNDPNFRATLIFQKNLTLFRNSFNLKKQPPIISEVQETLNLFTGMSQDTPFKSLFKKTKSVLLWFFSIYEFYTGKPFDKFSDNDWRKCCFFLTPPQLCELKQILFSSLRTSFIFSIKWDHNYDELLKLCTRQLYDQALVDQNYQFQISWATVSRNFNAHLGSLSSFKTAKDCKERWFNHLSPFLKKAWSVEEDIALLEEFLNHSKKWALISRTRNFIGRNQHQIKNRFIWVMFKTLGCSRKKVRDWLKGDRILGKCQLALEKLRDDQKESKFSESNMENANSIDFFNVDRFIDFSGQASKFIIE